MAKAQEEPVGGETRCHSSTGGFGVGQTELEPGQPCDLGQRNSPSNLTFLN